MTSTVVNAVLTKVHPSMIMMMTPYRFVPRHPGERSVNIFFFSGHEIDVKPITTVTPISVQKTTSTLP